MNNFNIYFQIGWQHIVTWQAFDHILFICALCLQYQFENFKKIALLVTAFTIGHTITLGVSMLNVFDVNAQWVEFLIAVTIFCSAFLNIFNRQFFIAKKISIIYITALAFGCIHGLGFSQDLCSLLGNKKGIALKIFAANVGIEAAQLCFVVLMLILSLLVTKVFKINKREYILFATGIIAGIAIVLAIERLPLTQILQ
jgi:HupE / UreJ protein